MEAERARTAAQRPHHGQDQLGRRHARAAAGVEFEKGTQGGHHRKSLAVLVLHTLLPQIAMCVAPSRRHGRERVGARRRIRRRA